MVKEYIITGDGSTTFYNEEFKQIYHSISGAVEESVEKFVKPCIKFKGKHPKILDICFGLGYNTAAALDILGPCSVVGLENDESILESSKDVIDYFKSYSIVRKAALEKKFNDGKTSIKIIVGDARENVKKLGKEIEEDSNTLFDIVFLDPFSPAACPELWTEEFMKDIFSVVKPGGILTTYSCARKVRDALKTAGFAVRDGPVVGRRAPATIAVK